MKPHEKRPLPNIAFIRSVKIRDISDRVYQGRVYALIQSAQSSIVISMYLIRPGDDPRHPINRLLQHLIEARRRGVEITIYMNTKLEHQIPAEVDDGPWFERLRKAGVKIHLIAPVRRLHDKLIVVDGRWVVEGSMNWSVAAIVDNFESATLIESKKLAQAKLRRISFFPIWDGKAKPRPPGRPEAPPHMAEFFPAGPPTSVEIPAAWIEEKKYFPAMISYRSERAMKLLLLLVYLSEAAGSRKFWLSLEQAAQFLDILQDKTRTAIRNEMTIIFRDLQKFADPVRATFYYNQDAEVELPFPPGPAFTVGSDDLGAGELAVLTDNEIFLRLMRARLRAEGRRIEDLSGAEIEKRFFLAKRTYRRTLGPRKQGRKPSPAPL